MHKRSFSPHRFNTHIIHRARYACTHAYTALCTSSSVRLRSEAAAAAAARSVACAHVCARMLVSLPARNRVSHKTGAGGFSRINARTRNALACAMAGWLAGCRCAGGSGWPSARTPYTLLNAQIRRACVLSASPLCRRCLETRANIRTHISIKLRFAARRRRRRHRRRPSTVAFVSRRSFIQVGAPSIAREHALRVCVRVTVLVLKCIARAHFV